MSGSTGCEAFGFFRSSLPVALFGAFDAASAEGARRSRFLLRRRDPEFIEIVRMPEPVVAPVVIVIDDDDVVEVEVPPVAPRRSRRVRGLDAEFDEIVRASCRRRLS